jgi:hypothetical protein
MGRNRINSSIDLMLSSCASSLQEVVLTSSHGRRAENVRISPICLNLVMYSLKGICTGGTLPIAYAHQFATYYNPDFVSQDIPCEICLLCFSSEVSWDEDPLIECPRFQG